LGVLLNAETGRPIARLLDRLAWATEKERQSPDFAIRLRKAAPAQFLPPELQARRNNWQAQSLKAR
jgi:hypothetical protein